MKIDSLVHALPLAAYPAACSMLAVDPRVSRALAMAVYTRLGKIFPIDLESPIAQASASLIALSRMAEQPGLADLQMCADLQLRLLGAGDALDMASAFVTRLLELPEDDIWALEAESEG